MKKLIKFFVFILIVGYVYVSTPWAHEATQPLKVKIDPINTWAFSKVKSLTASVLDSDAAQKAKDYAQDIAEKQEFRDDGMVDQGGGLNGLVNGIMEK